MQIYELKNRHKQGTMHRYTFNGMEKEIVTIKNITVSTTLCKSCVHLKGNVYDCRRVHLLEYKKTKGQI